MCNIAGYIGTKKAAPILFEMIKKQEGYAGGYYAGIATVNDNKILSQKLLGSVQVLENTIAKVDGAKDGIKVKQCMFKVK